MGNTTTKKDIKLLKGILKLKEQELIELSGFIQELKVDIASLENSGGI